MLEIIPGSESPYINYRSSLEVNRSNNFKLWNGIVTFIPFPMVDAAIANPLYALDPSSRIRANVYQDESVEIIANRIMNSLKDDIFFVYMKQLAWEHFVNTNSSAIANSSVASIDVKSKVRKFMDECGNKEVLISAVMKIYEHIRMSHTFVHPLIKQRTRSRTSADELNEVIREVRCVWERGINEELLAIGTELRRKFCVCRPNGVASPLLEESLTQTARESVRFLYDTEDLFETCVNIRNPLATGPGSAGGSANSSLGLLKLRVTPVPFMACVMRYRELSSSVMQLGVDDLHVMGGTVKFACICVHICYLCLCV